MANNSKIIMTNYHQIMRTLAIIIVVAIGSHFLTRESPNVTEKSNKNTAEKKQDFSGAIIILRTNVRDQVRVISSGPDRFTKYDNVIMFGLLKNESVMSSEIILPSGNRVEYKGNLNLMRVNEFVVPFSNH